jgi:hypothetical protein
MIPKTIEFVAKSGMAQTPSSKVFICIGYLVPLVISIKTAGKTVNTNMARIRMAVGMKTNHDKKTDFFAIIDKDIVDY